MILKRIERFMVRIIAKIKINSRKRTIASLSIEQKEIYSFAKSLIRKPDSKIMYCPGTSNVLIKNEETGKGILIKGETIMIIKADNLISSPLDTVVKEAIVYSISQVFENRVALAEEKYRSYIKEFNQ